MIYSKCIYFCHIAMLLNAVKAYNIRYTVHQAMYYAVYSFPGITSLYNVFLIKYRILYI